MANVLVTGGCGFIGSHLTERLAASGDRVTVFDYAASASNGGSIRYLRGDIRDEAAVADAVAGDTEVIYHLSAMVGVDTYLAAPADVVEVNLLGTRNVLRRAQADK